MKKKRTSSARGITLKDVIAHIQALRNDLLGNIGIVKIRLNHLEEDMKIVREDLVSLKKQVRIIGVGIENIDRRVDDIEVKRLPILERKVFS